MKTEGLMVRFPNKGRPTKKIYDKLQGLEVVHISLCDVMDGDAHRLKDLKRNVLTVQREFMLYERIKNAIETNLRMSSLCLFLNLESKTWT